SHMCPWFYTFSLHDALPIFWWTGRRALSGTRCLGELSSRQLLNLPLDPPHNHYEGEDLSASPSPLRGEVRRGPPFGIRRGTRRRSEEHTSELQSRENLVCRL